MKHVAYIALGSNIEPRSEYLLRAVAILDDTEGISLRQVSQLIQTPAEVGDPDSVVSELRTPSPAPTQPMYLNGAAKLVTDLPAAELLEAMLGIERALGRNRAREGRWGARTCDLDLLLYDQDVIDTPTLIVPHPRMHQRLFVLRPLAEIAPAVVHPVLKKTIAQLLEDLEGAACPPG
jgi:2-amino-4-hydroxy-6-hydroxymethyldihydropteridine diphosphokinase